MGLAPARTAAYQHRHVRDAVTRAVRFRRQGSSARLELRCGPAPADVRSDTVVFDPPWNAIPQIDIQGGWVLAFTDAQFIGDVIARFGSPAWLFTWDAVTCFTLSRRPLKRAKYALLYGDLSIYDKDIARNDRIIRRNPRGIRLMDVYQEPLAHLYREAGKHAKPLTWMRMLIGNCTRGPVVDPFGGTGTTLLACADLGRDCTLYEIDPQAQQNIIRRAREHGLEIIE